MSQFDTLYNCNLEAETPFNDQFVQARENKQSTAITYLERKTQASYLYPFGMTNVDPAFKDCDTYDPIGFLENFAGLPTAIDENTFKALYGVVAQYPRNYTGVSEICQLNWQTPNEECLRYFCGLHFGKAGNSFNQHIPVLGSFESSLNFTMSYLGAPLCLQVNHSYTIQRCTS